MSEGFHPLRLHDSSLAPVYDARCTLTISPMASSTACVGAGRQPLGNRCSIFKSLNWMFVPTTLLRFGHQATSSCERAEGFGTGLHQRLLRRCTATGDPCDNHRP